MSSPALQERAGATKRRNHYEPQAIALLTTYASSGSGAPHRHAASFDDWGNGSTDAGPDGHRHPVRGLEVLPSAGHGHALTEVRTVRGP